MRHYSQVLTPGKGPLVHAYHELRDLTAANGVRFLFEVAVTLAPAIAAVASAGVGGALIFSLFREALPAAKLTRFRGTLHSTTNLILTEMERGNTFEQAVKKAPELGTPALAAQVQVSPRPTPASTWTAGTPP